MSSNSAQRSSHMVAEQSSEPRAHHVPHSTFLTTFARDNHGCSRLAISGVLRKTARPKWLFLRAVSSRINQQHAQSLKTAQAKRFTMASPTPNSTRSHNERNETSGTNETSGMSVTSAGGRRRRPNCSRCVTNTPLLASEHR